MKTVAGPERRRYKPPRRRRGTVEDGGGGILYEQRNGVSITFADIRKLDRVSTLPSPAVTPPLIGEANAPRP